MSVHALKDYYDRVSARNPEIIAPYGFSEETIHFCILISTKGKFLDYVDFTDKKGSKIVGKRFFVPKDRGRQSGILPFFLWDKTSYALALTKKPTKKTKDQHAAFVELQRRILFNSPTEDGKIFLQFLNEIPLLDAKLNSFPEYLWDGNVIFSIDGTGTYLHDNPELKKAWIEHLDREAPEPRICLLTGEQAPPSVTHPPIRGIGEHAQTAIISINFSAAESYGKSQALNSPVSQRAAAAYTTGLNHLLRRENGHRVDVGELALIFWAEQPATIEEAFLGMQLDPSFDKWVAPGISSADTARLHDIAEHIAKGRPISELGVAFDESIKFFLLGLCPNAARIYIRFYHECSFGDLLARLQQHFLDLSLAPDDKTTMPSAYALALRSAPARYDSAKKRIEFDKRKIHQQLVGQVFQAIFTGREYPYSLLSVLLGRLRSDKQPDRLRFALIKALLVRRWRIQLHQGEDRYVSLDRENKRVGYLLGRLFAVFEKIQVDHYEGKVGSSIRDKFYGSASASPRGIFPVLQRNNMPHLSALRKSAVGWKRANGRKYEEEIGQIYGNCDQPEDLFQSHLSLEEQGLFAVGYYHQKDELNRRIEKIVEPDFVEGNEED